MSADNWGICPRCLKRARAEWDQLQVDVEEGYGVLPPDEWAALRDRSFKNPGDDLKNTLREDYEFWMTEDEGVLHVRYRAGCTEDGCGFSFNLEEEHQANV